MGDEYYIVRNNQVLKGKLIKGSRRGTIWDINKNWRELNDNFYFGIYEYIK